MTFLKHICLFAFVLLVVHHAYGVDYTRIDAESNFVPLNCKSPKEIAAYLTRKLFTPEEKVRALFYWTAHTISYDVQQLPGTDYRYVTGKRRDILAEAIEGHKGVCQHYAVMFDALCRAVGIPSWIVVGYTLGPQGESELSHAWNAVCIGGKYYCMDVTWSAGYIEDGKYCQEFNDKYFMVSPSKFIKTHIPFDPLWQFSDSPLPHRAANETLSSRNPLKPFSFKDSLTRIAGRDTLANLRCENQRVRLAGLRNRLTQDYYNFNEMLITVTRNNMLIKALNRSISAYNAYTQSRNTQFAHATMNTDSLKHWLTESREAWDEANRILKQSDTNDKEADRQIRRIPKQLQALKSELDNETRFLQQYIDTPQAERLKLFIVQ